MGPGQGAPPGPGARGPGDPRGPEFPGRGKSRIFAKIPDFANFGDLPVVGQFGPKTAILARFRPFWPF